MKLTVTQPVSPVKPADLDGLIYWQTREASPFESQVRTFCNQRESVQKFLTTAATGAYTTIYAEDLPFSAAWAVDVHVIGRATAGGAARARYDLFGLFYREVGGVAVQEGAISSLPPIESVAAFDATLAASGNGILVQVRDDAVRTMNWSLVCVIAEVL